MSDDLAAFMAARIGEVEVAAHRAAGADGRFGGRPHWSALGHGIVTDATDPDWGVVDLGPCIDDDALAAHIALHDPARELREVEAKRRRLRRWIEHDRLAAERRAEGRPSPATENIRDACWVAVLDDASVWSDHPGCRPEWNPGKPGVTPLTS